MNWKRTLLICFGIIVAGAALTLLIFSTEPTASRTGATKQSAMLVDVKEAEEGAYRPQFKALGTVRASQDIILRPQVNGVITELADDFTPGGYVKKGGILLQIDPSDYRNDLLQRKSELRQAKADLNIEMGRQDIAEQDYKLIEDSLSLENRALILREPQLDAVRSRVESAQAAVQQAELNLKRTTIRAPFDAHIVDRRANVGSQVSSGDELGRLTGLKTYWVVASVPQSKLRWLSFEERDENPGTEVIIRNRNAWPEDTFRTGRLYRLIGALEGDTRLARVIIEVDDPMDYLSDKSEKNRLMIDAFVETTIKAKELENVVRLNRDYLRQDEKVWVMDENDQLSVREVEIILQDAEYAYIKKGLSGGERIITSNLATVQDGAPLRLQAEEEM